MTRHFLLLHLPNLVCVSLSRFVTVWMSCFQLPEQRPARWTAQPQHKRWKLGAHSALDVQQHRPGGLDGVGVGPPALGAVRDVGPFFLIQSLPEGPTPPPAVWQAAQAPPAPQIQWTVRVCGLLFAFLWPSVTLTDSPWFIGYFYYCFYA